MPGSGDGPQFIRPGPAAILPGLCPGGVVVHVYAVPSGELVSVSRMHPLDDVAATAERDAATFDAFMAAAACLVAYDGDTGERMGADAWSS
jgi:hypothetical protein